MSRTTQGRKTNTYPNSQGTCCSLVVPGVALSIYRVRHLQNSQGGLQSMQFRARGTWWAGQMLRDAEMCNDTIWHVLVDSTPSLSNAHSSLLEEGIERHHLCYVVRTQIPNRCVYQSTRPSVSVHTPSALGACLTLTGRGSEPGTHCSGAWRDASAEAWYVRLRRKGCSQSPR